MFPPPSLDAQPRTTPALDYHRANLDEPRLLQETRLECDVVLPFFEHLIFIHEAAESVLSQSGVSVVLHLINDAGPHGQAVFDRWRSDPRVRTYQNEQNIGPFLSFNNVSPYFESAYVAVQDADDISLPQRLKRSVRLLQLSGAGILGGVSETFGDERVIRAEDGVVDQRVSVPRGQYRVSRYPSPGVRYFLENPTAVMRVDTFRALGGYADFGSREVNRSSLDTEFYARAYYSGVRFAMTKQIVLKYRCHGSSLMQCEETGWGSAAHATAAAERSRRIDLYQTKRFDPQKFGALGQHANLTQRIPT